MVALAQKHQMGGPSEPLSLVVMHTPKVVQASREDRYLRGRAIQLVGMISVEASCIEAIKFVGNRLMEEGLGDVEIDLEVNGILQEQGYETLIALPEGELVVAYHSLIRRTAPAESWTLPRNVREHRVTPFLPLLLEVTQMPMKAALVTNGEPYEREESCLRDDIANQIEEPHNWTEVSILEFFNSAQPTTCQITGLKSQPIVQVTSARDQKLQWREACDNDEVRGDQIFVSTSGVKSYVRRDTDMRVLYEGRPEGLYEMSLGQLAAEYRLMDRTSEKTEKTRGEIDDRTRLGPPSSSLVAGFQQTVAPEAMMMENGRIMVKRTHENKAVVRLLHHGATSKYANCLLWSPWQHLEDIATNQEEQETESQKRTRLSIYPMSVFHFVEEDDS